MKRFSPTELSEYLREGADPDLERRRTVIALSLLGTTAGQLVGAYQTGLIPHLPDPPGRIWDSDKTDASEYAYSRGQGPDGLTMILTYAITGALAAAGGPDRPKHQPALAAATFAKTVFDLVTTVELAREEWRDNRKLCAYCQTATLASLASVVLAAPEGLRALRRLRGSS